MKRVCVRGMHRRCENVGETFGAWEFPIPRVSERSDVFNEAELPQFSKSCVKHVHE